MRLSTHLAAAVPVAVMSGDVTQPGFWISLVLTGVIAANASHIEH